MRQYRCMRKYDHFLPILCTYVSTRDEKFETRGKSKNDNRKL